MNKLFTFVLIGINFYTISFPQGKTGFDKSFSNTAKYLNDSVIYSYIIKLNTENEESQYYQVLSIFNEIVDGARVILNSDDWNHHTYTDSIGIFSIPLSKVTNKSTANLKIFHEDYKGFDTTIIIKKNISPFFQRIYVHPKHKILVRGRLVRGSFPVEDVDVTIKHNDTLYHTITLGCYYDEEDYWNCLYNGMFKQDIPVEDPDDSLFISFNKPGFKSIEHGLRISEYNGDILKFKMKYADQLPFLPKHDAGLKIAFPMPWERSWYIGLSYYQLSPFWNTKRLFLGAEGVLVMSEETVEVHNSLPGTVKTNVDSIYITGFFGPSVKFMLTNPKKRYFSTYIGNTFSISVNKWEFAPQPFIGTRFFLDINKVVSIECRYLYYHQDIVEYEFNAFGNAVRSIKPISDHKLILNIGVQIIF